MRTAVLVSGLLWLIPASCKPKTTDTATVKDLNPCAQGEILASDGSCVSAAGGESDDTGG